MVSLEDVVKLLRAKDQGLEPNHMLIDYLDDLLTSIAS
jgi:hypothetical protein